jgi:vitamin K-dependent gamma-carboxylase
MTRRVQAWVAHLTAPVDGASLAVFRIVFGTMVAWDAGRYLYFGWVTEYYVEPTIHFTYYGFGFVRPWPGWGMYAHFWVLGAVALMAALGLFYRVTSVLLFLAYAYVFLLEESVYMNHHYLMTLVAFLLMWMPAERAFSLDRLRKPNLPATVPFWCVGILRFQLFVVYFYGAIAKLNPDWLAGEPMYSLIVNRAEDVPQIAHRFPPALLAYAIAYAGILIDAVVPVLLVIPRTVPYGFAIALVFHLLNEIFLHIGVFSYLMSGAVTIFFAPDWPRRLWRRLKKTSEIPAPSTNAPQPRTSAVLLVGLHVYVLAQLLVPLRHLLYPGYVSWTEEGHRFAWHMKLRKKESTMVITVTDPASGRRWTVDPAEDLRPRQLRKLHTFPDILLQYAHHLRDRLRADGISDPMITVDWMCSLNGAPPRRLVDPQVNLAAVERSIWPAPWLLRDPPPPEEAETARAGE